MTERVTVEHNGERFTIEVPDGTPDDEIQRFVTQQSQSNSVDQNIAAGAVSPVARTIGGYYGATHGGIPGAVYREAKDLAGVVAKSTPEMWTDVFAHPIENTREGIKALAQRYTGSAYTQPIGQTLSNIAKTNLPNIARGAAGILGSAVTAPENAVMLPYNMAAYEQNKIRANPTAPEYANNPFAMVQRGQAPTQGQAGAMNQRNLVRTQANPQDALNMMIREAAAKKALAQPTIQ